MLKHAEQAGWQSVGAWLFGILLLTSVILVAFHISELEHFTQLIVQAHPLWLVVAVLLQASTYLFAAKSWVIALRQAGHPHSLRELIPLSLVRLFIDQAFPSGGLSGTVLLIQSLERRGVPAAIGMGVFLVGMVSFYSAYAALVLLSLGIFWLYHDISWPLILLVGLFVTVAISLPAAVLWLRHWGNQPLPWGISRLPGISWLSRTVMLAPAALLKDQKLFIRTAFYQMAVFLADTATLWVVLQAIGQKTGAGVALVGFMAASVAATLGPIPLGLGTFEAVLVMGLVIQGLSVEAALAATLLLRGFTFWLPMIPGLWLARRELKSKPLRRLRSSRGKILLPRPENPNL